MQTQRLRRCYPVVFPKLLRILVEFKQLRSGSISETLLSQKKGCCQKTTLAIVVSSLDLRGVSPWTQSLQLVLL